MMNKLVKRQKRKQYIQQGTGIKMKITTKLSRFSINAIRTIKNQMKKKYKIIKKIQ